IEDRQVIEAGGAGRRRRAAEAVPGVERDVVVIAAGREEGRLAAAPLGELEAQDVAIKRQRTIEVGDLEVHMADTHAVGDGARRDAVGKGLEAGGHGVRPFRNRLRDGVRPLSGTPPDHGSYGARGRAAQPSRGSSAARGGRYWPPSAPA